MKAGPSFLSQIMIHEGVESRGKTAVLRKLSSVCELQHALGTNKMVVDCIQMQSQSVSLLACSKALTTPVWHKAQ